MEDYVSSIKPLDISKRDVYGLYAFNKLVTINDIKFLEEEFDLTEEKAKFFVTNYKPVGLVFRLTASNPEGSKDWKLFLLKVFKSNPELSKLENVYLSSKTNKLLLLTNKRLLKIDLRKLNERIMDVNFRIESYNEKIGREIDKLSEEQRQEKGFFGRMMESLKK